MRARLGQWTTTIAATLAAACTPGGGPVDAGPAGPTPALFGLVDDRCFVYADTAGDTYTIEVDADATTLTGIDAWKLTHRLNGFRTRLEYFDVTEENDLRLHRIQKWPPGDGQNDTLWRFKIPAVFADPFLRLNGRWETELQADFSGAGQTSELRNIAFKTEIVEVGDVTWADGTFPAFRMVVNMFQTPGDQVIDRLWIAKDWGFVKFHPQGGREMALEKVRLLDRTDASDHCTQ